MQEITVLGEKYTIEVLPEKEDSCLETSDGYCDFSTHNIIIRDMTDTKEEPNSLRDMEMFTNKVKRHEIIHAFLCESGLHCESFWATNEEMVDWLAIQFPKILKAFEEANCI